MITFADEELDTCKKLVDVQKRMIEKKDGIINALRLELDAEKRKQRRQRPASVRSLNEKINKLKLLRNRFDVEALMLVFNMLNELKRINEHKKKYFNGVNYMGDVDNLIKRAEEWMEKQPVVPSLVTTESTGTSSEEESEKKE